VAQSRKEKITNPADLDERDVLTRTVIGEARGESPEGQAAVAHVILNRARQGFQGDNIKDVALRHNKKNIYQFSTWNPTDPNREFVLNIDTNGDLYKRVRKVVDQVVDGTHLDNTDGSLHYYANWMEKPPAWAKDKDPAATIGNHYFFNDID
jgi:spore germination cell wall hydrolase CwlJ-like protein